MVNRKNIIKLKTIFYFYAYNTGHCRLNFLTDTITFWKKLFITTIYIVRRRNWIKLTKYNSSGSYQEGGDVSFSNVFKLRKRETSDEMNKSFCDDKKSRWTYKVKF